MLLKLTSRLNFFSQDVSHLIQQVMDIEEITII